MAAAGKPVRNYSHCWGFEMGEAGVHLSQETVYGRQTKRWLALGLESISAVLVRGLGDRIVEPDQDGHLHAEEDSVFDRGSQAAVDFEAAAAA